ncbi:MAG TPA: hypothetical protein VHW09_29425 [Bryobacteraceae bacterium]|jgi:hypothetical protein|nr:hypothetical protein [Bryobacteraceae bacterium]
MRSLLQTSRSALALAAIVILAIAVSPIASDGSRCGHRIPVRCVRCLMRSLLQTSRTALAAIMGLAIAVSPLASDHSRCGHRIRMLREARA